MRLRTFRLVAALVVVTLLCSVCANVFVWARQGRLARHARNEVVRKGGELTLVEERELSILSFRDWLPGLKKYLGVPDDIEHLLLSGDQFNEKALLALHEIGECRQIEFSDTRAKAGFVELVMAARTSRVAIRNVHLETGALKLLPAVRHIAALDLSGSTGVSKECRFISDADSLEHLDLSGTDVNDESLEELRLGPTLLSKSLNRCSVSCEGLPVMPILEIFSANDAKISDTGFHQICRNTSLRWLEIGGNCGVSDGALSGISALTKLEKCGLHRTKAGRITLSSIGSCKWLRDLDLSSTCVDGDMVLEGLKPLGLLETVQVTNTFGRGATMRSLERIMGRKLSTVGEIMIMEHQDLFGPAAESIAERCCDDDEIAGSQ